MKTKNLLKCLIAVAAVFIYSCSSDSNEEPTGGGNGGGSGITSITVTASANSIELGNSITFTVTANDGTNVSANSTIRVNGSSISGLEYTPTATGTFGITARYEGINSGQINVEVLPPVITALRVESVSPSVKVGDTAEFTVIGTDANDNEYTITDTATISVNGSEIEGNKFMAVAMGDLNATASLDALSSDMITVTVTEETAPGTFARNAVIEDFTGTWCGWCPRVSYAIEQVQAQTDRVFVVAAHNGDTMENTYSTELDNHFPITGYPAAYINRDAEWTYPEPSNVSQATSLATGTTSSGLSINSMLKGNQLQVYVSAGFAQTTSGAKLVVYVLEDGIIASQANYTSYYGGVNPVPQFEHNHTLRYSITSVLGDAIPSGNTMANSKYTQVFDIPVPSLVNNSSKMSIIAMIVGSDDKVINVNGAHVGTDKDFQAN